MIAKGGGPKTTQIEKLLDAVERVMGEAEEWKHILSLEGDTVLTVYLDMKSPHAYICLLYTSPSPRDS